MAILAGFALASSATWRELPVGWVVLLAAMPSVGWLGFSRPVAWQTLAVQVKPGEIWHLTLKKIDASGIVTAKSERQATLVQAWHHFFGLTLALNFRIDPHNKPECIKLTVWRCNVSPETFRRLCVLSAWQMEQPDRVFLRESV